MKSIRRRESNRHALQCMAVAIVVPLVSAPAFAQNWSQVAKLLAGDGHETQYFGEAVAIDADTVIVGSSYGDGRAFRTGAAYVYGREPDGAWAPRAKLFAEDGEDLDWFGYAVSIDGDVAAVGAPFNDGGSYDVGAAYVFERDAPGVWSQTARLIAPDGEPEDFFGEAIAVSGDAVIVGAPQSYGRAYQSGSACVYRRDAGGAWTLEARLIASDGQDYDFFGDSVSIDGDTAVIGAPQASDVGYWSGAAYVFVRDAGGAWIEQAKLFSADARESQRFGQAVAVRGDRALIGAPNDDDRGLNAGAAYAFIRDANGAWSEEAKLLAGDGAANDQFGISVSLDDGVAVAGAYWDGDNGSNSGSAYVYRNSGNAWMQEAKLLPDDGDVGDWFGASIGVSDGRAVVGSPYDDDLGDRSGSAYVFERESPGPQLTLVGDCPGPMRLTLTGATPRARAAIVAGFNADPFTVPGGPCPGARLDIRPPFAPGTPFAFGTDTNGVAIFEQKVPPSACGVHIQAIDLTTCLVSNIVTLP